jgi:hypothetical protein
MISSGTHTVVQAALDIQALADAGGQPLVADHRQPKRRIGGGQNGGQGGRRPDVQLGEQGQAGQGAGHDGEWQANPEQPYRQPSLPAEAAQVDPDGVGEQHQGQGGLGQQPNVLVGDLDLDQVQDPVADQQAEGDKDHRLGDHRGLQPARQRP